MPSEAIGNIGGEQTLLVFARIRPISEDETVAGATQISHKIDEKVVVLLDPLEDPDDILRANRSRERRFVFDQAFDETSNQDDVYQHSTKFLIENVIRGYNATVFAYGATGAGKTYTMLGTDEEPGIMFRAVEEIFMAMQQTSEESFYKLSMSYLEIYNENVRDLLNPASGVLDLREDAKGVQVPGLREVEAESPEEVMTMLLQGNLMRTTEPTAANRTSSRSHAILQVTVRQRSRIRDSSEEIRTGRLFLIDLAGSERASNTLNRGKRLVEGAHINRSLLALGNCINALSDRGGHRYVNYRDSKLTRLLKDALGGNCKTVMIAHISPASFHFEESRNTLSYADRAKHIKTKVRRNVTDVNYHVAQYTNIISELRQEIFRLRSRLEDANTAANKAQSVEKEAKRVELGRLKDQLLSSFQEQMDLRYKIMHTQKDLMDTRSEIVRLLSTVSKKGIMDLDNTVMEITLEIARYSLLVSEWESEKAFRIQNRDDSAAENKEDGENPGSVLAFEEPADPDDVVHARNELKVLQEDLLRFEKQKRLMEKDLDMSRQKAKRMEEILPAKISSEEHKQILSLLCKVHELEIENTEMQSEAFLKEHEIRKRDLIITKFKNHHQLCDEIISQQRQILYENKIECSKELLEMMDLYQQDMADPVFTTSVSMSDLSHLKSLYGDKGDHSYLDGISSDDNKTRRFSVIPAPRQRSFSEDDKVFSQSPKTRHIQEARIREERSQNPVVARDTRNIHALAAARRHRLAHHSQPGHPSIHGHTDAFLTPSRLAKHDRTTGSWGNLRYVQSDDQLSIGTNDRHSNLTDHAPRIHRYTDRMGPAKGPEKKKGRSQSIEPSYGEVNLNSTNPRKVGEVRPLKRTQPTNLNNRNRTTKNSYAAQHDTRKQVREFETSSQSSSTVYQIAPEKGKGLAVQKNYRAGKDVRPSPVGTPQRDARRARKPPPTIPPYKKADVGIVGYAIAR